MTALSVNLNKARFAARSCKGNDMEELDKKFVEPVVLGRLPFEMDADVARDAVLHTHQLVMQLIANASGKPDDRRDSEPRSDSHPTAEQSR